MTISIQLQTADELKLLEPLLQMLQQFEVNVSITSEASPTGVNKPSRSNRPKDGLVERLYGSIKVPEDFDYKAQSLI